MSEICFVSPLRIRSRPLLEMGPARGRGASQKDLPWWDMDPRAKRPKGPQGSTPVACISIYAHLVQEERRIKLFALKNFNMEFYFQNNKAPKEKEAILLT